jgi:hypothetical protein
MGLEIATANNIAYVGVGGRGKVRVYTTENEEPKPFT